MLEAAKVETSEPVVVNVEEALETVEAVDEIEAEKLDESDKSSPSTLFKTAAHRPKLVLANRDQLGIFVEINTVNLTIWDKPNQTYFS